MIIGKLDTDLVTNIEFDGIDHRDYPDFCDAYISAADYDGEPMTETELEELNEDRKFVYENLLVYENLIKYLY